MTATSRTSRGRKKQQPVTTRRRSTSTTRRRSTSTTRRHSRHSKSRKTPKRAKYVIQPAENISYSVSLKTYKKWEGSQPYNWTILPGIKDFPPVLDFHRGMILDLATRQDEPAPPTKGTEMYKFPRNMNGKRLRTHQLFVLSGLVEGHTVRWKNSFLWKAAVREACADCNVTGIATTTVGMPPRVMERYVYVTLVAYLWRFLLSASDVLLREVKPHASAHLTKIRPRNRMCVDEENLYIAPVAAMDLPEYSKDKFKDLLQHLNELFLRHKLVTNEKQDVHEIPTPVAVSIHTALVNYFYRHTLDRPPMKYVSYVAYVTIRRLKAIINGSDPHMKDLEIYQAPLRTSYEKYQFRDGELIPPTRPPAYSRYMYGSSSHSSAASSSSSSASSSSSSSKGRRRISFKMGIK